MTKLSDIQQAIAEQLAQVRGTERHLICPMCDGQGEVIEAVVTATQTPIFICDECDATWFGRSDVTRGGTSAGYGPYMESIGLDARWDHLTIVTQIEP